jgi:hypothetical protein
MMLWIETQLCKVLSQSNPAFQVKSTKRRDVLVVLLIDSNDIHRPLSYENISVGLAILILLMMMVVPLCLVRLAFSRRNFFVQFFSHIESRSPKLGTQDIRPCPISFVPGFLTASKVDGARTQ